MPMFSQFALSLGGSGFSLLPLRLILVAMVTLPAAALASTCAWIRARG